MFVKYVKHIQRCW